MGERKPKGRRRLATGGALTGGYNMNAHARLAEAAAGMLASRAQGQRTEHLAVGNPKATIYTQGPMGAFGKVEGYLVGVGVSDYQPGSGNVEYIPKGGRKPRTVMTYYSPAIVVVRGWGHPAPPGAWKPAPAGSKIREGKWRSADPRWGEEFQRKMGPKLPEPVVVFWPGKPAVVKL